MEPRPNVTVVPFTGGTAGARPPPLPEARSDDAEAALHASLLPLRAVRFAHAVNTRASLDRACADAAVNVLEGDVVLAGDAAVMGHDVGAAAADAVPVADWLAAAAAAGKGAKLDVKEFGAVAAVLAALGAHDVRVEDGGAPPWPVLRFPLSGAGFLTRPALFLNADVLAASGSGGRACAFNAGGRAVATADQVDAVRALVERVGDAAPSAIMSVGWTTGREGGEYVDADVDAMLAAVGDVAALGVAITFPVRASWVRPSWGTLQVRDRGVVGRLGSVNESQAAVPVRRVWIERPLR